jgi:hypothetical protein
VALASVRPVRAKLGWRSCRRPPWPSRRTWTGRGRRGRRRPAYPACEDGAGAAGDGAVLDTELSARAQALGRTLTLPGKPVPVRVVRPLTGQEQQPFAAGECPRSARGSAVDSVLTYIRRSFGNQADPIAPAAVTEVRGAATGRIQPWTDETLDDRG